jgi:hypothetical protein
MRQIAILLSLVLSSPAWAAGQSTSPSAGSVELSAASAELASGSLDVVAASGHIVVQSVQASGDGVVLVLEGAAAGARAVVRLTGKAAHGLSVAAGTAVEVSVLSTGYLLVASGQALAFVPNEAGRALLHHSRVGE